MSRPMTADQRHAPTAVPRSIRPRRGRAAAATVALAVSFLTTGFQVTPAGAQTLSPTKDNSINVKVVNDCYVQNADGTTTSYFGYELKKPASASLVAGTGANFMTGAPANSGQPSAFSAGTHSLVFSVTWSAGGTKPAWYLNGVKAEATSKTICKEVPAVPEFPFALVGPVAAMAAFGVWFHLRRRAAWVDAAVT